MGDAPTFKLVAKNTSETEAKVDWAVSMSATEPTSALARRMPTPRSIWQKKGATTVPAKAMKEVVLGTDTKLPAGSISVTLSSEKQAVVAMRFGIQGEKKPGELAERQVRGVVNDVQQVR